MICYILAICVILFEIPTMISIASETLAILTYFTMGNTYYFNFEYYEKYPFTAFMILCNNVVITTMLILLITKCIPILQSTKTM